MGILTGLLMSDWMENSTQGSMTRLTPGSECGESFHDPEQHWHGDLPPMVDYHAAPSIVFGPKQGAMSYGGYDEGLDEMIDH